MAKLKAPLMSFGASGKIAGSLVFFGWKGIDAVREYVVPANPRSAPQQAQRAHLTGSVDAWHSLAFTDADRVGWNRWAGTLAKIMSGFNGFIRSYIDQSIRGKAYGRVSDVRVAVPTVDGFDVDIEDSIAGRYFTCVIGTSRTHFPTRVDLVDDTDNTYSLTWASGESGTDYYVMIEEQVTGTWERRSGIYHIKTS